MQAFLASFHAKAGQDLRATEDSLRLAESSFVEVAGQSLMSSPTLTAHIHIYSPRSKVLYAYKYKTTCAGYFNGTSNKLEAAAFFELVSCIANNMETAYAENAQADVKVGFDAMEMSQLIVIHLHIRSRKQVQKSQSVLSTLCFALFDLYVPFLSSMSPTCSIFDSSDPMIFQAAKIKEEKKLSPKPLIGASDLAEKVAKPSKPSQQAPSPVKAVGPMRTKDLLMREVREIHDVI